MHQVEDQSQVPRERANTLEKSERIRPPIRRKRRPSSSEFSDNARRLLRSGSVPPSSTSTSSDSEKVPECSPGRTGPYPVPRITRIGKKAQPIQKCISGPNTPTGSTLVTASTLDLSDIAPFGTPLGASPPKLESGGPNKPTIHRNSVKCKSNKWTWIWSRNKDSPPEAGSSPGSTMKNFHFGRRPSKSRKSRHISCPDITSASNDSSRSTSPVSFTLTSLFGSNLSGSTLRRSLAQRELNTKQSCQASTNLAQQRFFDDFATEIVNDLRPVQYCQIYPYQDDVCIINEG